jgi:hypothetical protein
MSQQERIDKLNAITARLNQVIKQIKEKNDKK